MEKVILSLIANLKIIEVRGEHAERLGACIKTLERMLEVTREANAMSEKAVNQDGAGAKQQVCD